jgi:hypothetical protein
MGLGIGIGDTPCINPRGPGRFSLGLGFNNCGLWRFLPLAAG